MLLKAHHHPRRQARGSRRVVAGGNIIHAEGETLEIGPLRYKVSGASSGRGAGQYFAGHFPRISVT